MAGGEIYRIGGKDRVEFLQGLVTNDLRRLKDGPVYAALLTPQGKYLADFFLIDEGPSILLDIAPAVAPGALRRLGMYRLRSDATIDKAPVAVIRQQGPGGGALPDPRHPALGFRRYVPLAEVPAEAPADWDAVRVEHVIPESGIELIPDDSYILENGFERLHGVDFRKGCYVGQEVTARMKHRADLAKGLVQVVVDGAAPPGTPILARGKDAGTLFTQSGGRGLAHLRFDRASGPMEAGTARVTWPDAPDAGSQLPPA